MIHLDKHNSFYVLLGTYEENGVKVAFNLYCFSLAELIKQAKEIYKFDCLTLLN